MSKNDGGPAFPERGSRGIATGGEGMSMRDYFAAKAMQGILSNPDGIGFPDEKIAKDAYWMADAMLKVREEGK